MKVILFGVTGMLGQGVLQECLQADDVTEIVAVVRSPLPSQTVANPKIHQLVCQDFSELDLSSVKNLDGCFYTLGMSSNGVSPEQYRQTMHDLPLSIAKKLLPNNPNMTFIFISGQGTNADGKGWAKTLGEAENDLQAIGFKQFIAFRPAVIQPLDGIESKTDSYRNLYKFTAPILSLARKILPNQVLTTQIIGQAMLNAVRFGYENKVANSTQINQLASHHS